MYTAEHGLAGCGGDGRQPALGPVRDGGQHRFKCPATGGKPIAHTHRRTRIHETLHEALGLELTQPLGENSITDARYAGEQLIESSRSRDQCFHDRPGPALSYQLDGALKGRAVVEAPTDHGERFYALSVVAETIALFYFNDFLDATLDGLVPDQQSRRYDGGSARGQRHSCSLEQRGGDKN